MVELVDTLVLEASARACEFESRLGHQFARHFTDKEAWLAVFNQLVPCL
jgi:hypothetical protein